MKNIQKVLSGLLILASLPNISWGAEPNHGSRLVANMQIYIRARSCDPEMKACISIKRKAKRTECYIPSIEWPPNGTDPEVVQARVKVDATGKARDVELVRKSNFEMFDKAVVASVAFCPMGVIEVDGVPKESEFVVEFSLHSDGIPTFRLVD